MDRLPHWQILSLLSGDNCCGDGADYAVLVARADSAFGPFTTLAQASHTNSSAILQKDSAWMAPGHNSIFSDGNDNQYIAYHAIHQQEYKAGKSAGKNKYVRRVMCILPLHYENGWPVVDKR